MTTPELFCAICGKNIITAVHHSNLLNKLVTLKEKNISSFVAKSKARGETDWMTWEGKKELTVHEGCRQQFKNKASHPPMNKRRKMKNANESACNVFENSSDALDTLINNSCDVQLENQFSVIENNTVDINAIVDEVWLYIESSERFRFDSKIIENILDGRIFYIQLCDALLEKHGEAVEIVQGHGRSQFFQRRINVRSNFFIIL